MHGWFQKLLKSRVSLSAQREQEAKGTENSVSSVSSQSFCASSSSPGATPSKPLQPQSALSSLLRWSRKYDVFVCHSSVDSDIEEAGRLVSFLEAAPRGLRCFLLQRDDCPGGAISTELCQAVQNSHLWALLITPNFLQDEWCKYIMHQALAVGPMSNRIIPLVQNLSHSQYPQELKFYIYIDLSKSPDRGYKLLTKTVLKYLGCLIDNEKTLDCNVDSSSNELSGEGSSKKDKLLSKCDPAATSVPLEVIKKSGESFSDICCDHYQQ
ncbi:toll/interleukin-1 receptor domain-containing adapter protein [Micropterus salmoides]|uniref:toll/interleukin-1 receptor domain-containing adapter protein n=1 Tax=Micropterus salmoides TaxID=27706 RepID=UPI0018EC1274|nr:toll/interleukin-1 receptor domain-containing adapter protein [Micropterus salmoides]